jgi:hypothetical protein
MKKVKLVNQSFHGVTYSRGVQTVELLLSDREIAKWMEIGAGATHASKNSFHDQKP